MTHIVEAYLAILISLVYTWLYYVSHRATGFTKFDGNEPESQPDVLGELAQVMGTCLPTTTEVGTEAGIVTGLASVTGREVACSSR